jgi:DNA-binding response OmpR family regulator
VWVYQTYLSGPYRKQGPLTLQDGVLGGLLKSGRFPRLGHRCVMAEARLLLVTHYSDERTIYGDAFRAAGFDVRLAEGPEDAFLAAVTERPDVVVTRVPQLGTREPGSELLRRLKQEDQTRSMRVVILTSLMQPEHRTRAVSAGCDGYLLIPALPDTLLAEVRRILLHRPNAASQATA